jgi:hypothetical protein
MERWRKRERRALKIHATEAANGNVVVALDVAIVGEQQIANAARTEVGQRLANQLCRQLDESVPAQHRVGLRKSIDHDVGAEKTDPIGGVEALVPSDEIANDVHAHVTLE